MTEVDSLKARYAEIKDRIAAAAERSGRDAASVVLVAVSKYSGVEQIRELIGLGHRDFGESQVQQLMQRAAMIDEWTARQRVLPGAAAGPAPEPVRWHMIGHLQRNKARKAVELCRLIHSVDNLRVAEELHALALAKDVTVDVLVQVNVAGEKTKFGCALPAAPYFSEQIESMAHLRVRGLMVMAPHCQSPEESRGTFARGRELFEDMRSSGLMSPHFNILSMGMSSDFEVAISEGSNMVRIGSSLFGETPAGMPEAEDDRPE